MAWFIRLKSYPYQSVKIHLWGGLGLCLAWLGFLYADSLARLWTLWQTDEYSHGVLLPVISLLWGVLLLQQKPVPLAPSFSGIFLLAGGLFINLGGMIIANNWLSHMSLVASVTGIVWTFFGTAALRRLALPLFFLLFSVPLPVTLTPLLTAHMQLLSSHLGVGIVQLLGISVYQEGNLIDFGFHKFDVAAACSGLRYLFPLTSFGFLVGFCVYRTWWKRGALFLSTIPIAIGMNAFRIALTGVIASWLGPESVEGMLHVFEGFVVFGLCLAALFLMKKLIDILSRQKEAPAVQLDDFSWKKPLWTGAAAPSIKILALLILLFGIVSAAYFLQARAERGGTPPHQSFAGFPLSIGEWTGRRDTLSAPELETLKLSDYFLGHYTHKREGQTVTFYTAYYDKQTQDNSIHSPQICLPGSGWKIVSRGIHSVGSLQVSKEIIQKGGSKMLVYYWYREGGHDAATNMAAKVRLFRNAVQYGRTDGSLLRLTTSIDDVKGPAYAEKTLDSFLQDVLPVLSTYE